jgi:hypothetical protein
LDHNGNPTENMVFDAWGKRRALDASYGLNLTTFSRDFTTRRGYTNHEQADQANSL